MRVFGPLLTALTVTIALLLGVAGGASAHAVPADHHSSMPADHHSAPAAGHDQSQAPCDHCPGRAGGQGMPMAAPCCPGLAAPVRVQGVRLMAVQRVAWHPADIHRPGSRLIGPEPPPPKMPL